MRRIAVLAAMAALTLAACGGNDNESSSTPAATEAATDTPTAAATDTPTEAAGGSGAKLAIAADPGGALKFTESKLTAQAGTVEIDFSNQAQIPHAVAIEGNGLDEKTTETVTGADAPPLSVDLKPGTYTFYCPVDGHRAAGMEGTITVK
ncbi:plastocyanin/azurin family copper-binding protein [Solirubrobacter ginsenosidimutans]|uniref:Plastocyanin/azurin family copper-binding protein n=1 Tax=Solirubrobacter ginsenosidimutans TaxID=490573 RepID=A0A9X3MYN3_9ACTN|nr:plastocyanin/azurin family copper-binding protein [Solirubrobacter ginsenosidimutans]MDA0163567.1 plastocyanin/azurin family copper-binding protein [Solirubrobacter ginsenosidimutans]